jgi:D-sedoheptulose 7-phosphate isomerase
MNHERLSPGHNTPDMNGNTNSVRGYFELHGKVLRELPHTLIEQISLQLLQAYQEGRRVYLFGNGGSAALASHFACDLGKGTVLPRNPQKRLQVMSLTDNLPLLTAWANDTSYDQVFAEQLRNLIQSGDIAIAISASGNSPNVVLALQVARELGALNIGLSGYQGGKMKALCDLCVVVPSDNMQIIEDLHVGIAHAVFTVVRHRICDLAPEFMQAAGG